MRKILAVVLCLVLLLGLPACKKEKNYFAFSSKYANFEVVEDWDHFRKVLVDDDTGVLYIYYRDNYGQTLTPIYNADGTLKNIKDFE